MSDSKRQTTTEHSAETNVANEVDDKQTTNTQPHQKRNLIVIIAIAITLIGASGAGGYYWYITYQIPHNEAVERFGAATDGLEERNAELEKTIKSIQKVLKSGDKPLDPTRSEQANSAIGEAQGAIEHAPDMPRETDEINAVAQQIKSMGNYTAQLNNLSSAKTELEKSIAQLKQVTNPAETFVIGRLTGLENITGVEAATEGNDPNGSLNKAGGYTAAVFFSSNLVDQSQLYLSGQYTPIIDAGCDGGGVVEVFKTTEDAEKRNEYLAGFDGSVLAPGSHTIIGTCVVRTSNLITASQQQAQQQAIIDSLTRLD